MFNKRKNIPTNLGIMDNDFQARKIKDEFLNKLKVVK
jgi:sulfur transfer complex TusBCD TusB component (DsrH family)